MRAVAFLPRIARNVAGTAAIETAICLPVLLTMALGSFEVGRMVSRQQELQSGANEAQAIILAAAAGTGASSEKLEEVLQDSLGIPLDNITLTAKFRCGTAAAMVEEQGTCGTEVEYQFVELRLEDRYEPVWTSFGVGEPLDYNLVRTIQVS